jgi:hypothetical protein
MVLTLLVVSGRISGTPASIQPATYNITTSIPAPDLQGNITAAEAFGAKTDACSSPPSTAFATSGTITINTVGSSVTGSADVTFSDGGHVSGSFSAPMCNLQVDVCSLLADLTVSCIAQSCVP